jgi:hypothetical protein
MNKNNGRHLWITNLNSMGQSAGHIKRKFGRFEWEVAECRHDLFRRVTEIDQMEANQPHQEDTG